MKTKRMLSALLILALAASLIALPAFAEETPENTILIAANTDYTVTLDCGANGAVVVSAETAAAGDTVSFVLTPVSGYTAEIVSVAAADGSEVELTAVTYGESYTFTMPAQNVTITVTFMEDNSMLNFFMDVQAGAYCYDAVLWAAENGIAGGVDSFHFAPGIYVTRAQMVTFLWRNAGCPVVNYAMTFTDVKEDAYYAEAVRWAVSEGITNGVTDTEFRPYDYVTRAQAVAFLWRYAKAPMIANMTANGPAPSPFTDVSNQAYYYSAVFWAKANGITSGSTETTFEPYDYCTRGQVVTFLYRYVTAAA